MIKLLQRIFVFACLSVILVLIGCSEQASQVDDTPFRESIVKYLEAKNMALRIKEVKAGPTIDGGNARLSASLTHDQLGGPSVTWEFQFAKQTDGTWLVIGHED